MGAGSVNDLPPGFVLDGQGGDAPPPGFVLDQPPADTPTVAGVAARGAERGVLPAGGAMVGAGAGAELGGLLGTLGGPAAPVTVPVGAAIGGIGGAVLGGTAMGKAQEWLFSHLPDGVVHALGQDPQQQAADEAAHPYVKFGSELAPNLLTMRPGGVATAVEDNAPAIAKIMGNPLAARGIGAGLGAGTEAGSELTQGQDLNPGKIAIAGTAGAVMNKPTALGESLSNFGSLAGRFFKARGLAVPANLTPQTLPPEILADMVKDPDVLKVLQANGVVDSNDPRVAQAAQALPARRAVEAEQGQRPIETDQAQVAAEKEAIAVGDLNPAAAAAVNAQRAPVPDVLPVTPRGQADTGEPGVAAAVDLRGNPRMPVVTEPQPTRLTPEDVTRSQANMEGGQPNAVPEHGTMVAPEGRLPQTSADVAGQREAGQAFTLADQQRGRLAEAPATVDTTTAGRPEGVNAQPVFLDEGHPVQVLKKEFIPDTSGRAHEVATVQRYDPRTGQPAPDAVQYQIRTRDLTQADYAAEPRQAQDFVDQSQSPANPELPRQPTQPIAREPAQTFRATAPDPTVADAGGPTMTPDTRQPVVRAAVPEQPAGPAPGRPFSTTEEVLRDFQAREQSRQQGAGQEQPQSQQQQYAGQKFSNTPSGQDAAGSWKTDANGFVMSDKGGPIKFGDQKQAAKWVLNQGQSKSGTGQYFELENHPSGKGFTVRERGRTQAETPPGAVPNNEKPATAGQTAPEPRALPEVPAEPAPEAAPVPTPKPAADSFEQKWKELGDLIKPKETQDHGVPAPESEARPNPAEHAAAVDEGSGGARSSQGQEAEGETPASPRAADSAPAADAGSRINADDAGTGGGDTGAGQGDTSAARFATTFYSNPIGDPELWKAVGRAVSPEASAWAQGMKTLAGSVVNVLKSTTALTTQSLGRMVVDVHNFLIGSKAGQMMTIAGRTGSAAVRELHDMFMSDPSGKKSVGRTFDEAIQHDASRWMNKLGQILDPLTKGMGKAEKAVLLDQLGKQIRTGQYDPKTAMGAAARQIGELLADVHARATAAGMEIGKAKNYLPREIDIEKAISDPGAFMKAAKQAYMADGLSAKDATEAAESWHRSLWMKEMGVRPDNMDFVRLGSGSEGGNATKGRVLSAKAESVLSKAGAYYDNPADALDRYFHRIARAAAWTERMGPNLEKWAALKQRMVSEGVGDSTSLVVDLVSKMAGMHAPMGKAARITSNVLRTLTAYTYLTGAPILHIGQSVMTAARTGNPINTLRAYGTALQVVTGHAKGDVRMAETLGLIERGMGDLLTETVGTKGGGTGKFFQMVGMSSLLRAQAIGNMNAAFAFVRHLAFDDASVSNTRHLNGLGVPEAVHAGFKEWVKGLQDGTGTPSFEDFAKPGKYPDMMQLAAQRVVNQVLMRPTAAFRPTWAEHPIGSLVYGITSYAQAFNKLATERAWNMGKAALTEGGLTPRDRIAMLAPAAFVATLWTPIQYALWSLRQDTLNANPDKPPKLPTSTAGWIERIASTTGLLGRYEMPYNLIAGIKFSRDPASSLTGPEISGLSDVVKRSVDAFNATKEQGVNAKRNLADSIYRNMVYPALMAAMVHTPLPPDTPFGLLVKGATAYAARNPVVRHDIFVNPVTDTDRNTMPKLTGPHVAKMVHPKHPGR